MKGGQEMTFIKLEPQATEKIKTFIKDNGVNAPLRIDLQSTGCCDPSLGICVDRAREDDMICERDGLKFLISSSVHQTVGDVTIGYSADAVSKGYVLTSSRPLSEWEGFGLCDIKIEPGE